VTPLLAQLPRPEGGTPDTIVLVGDRTEALELAAEARSVAHCRPVYPVIGLDRAARLLSEGVVRTLVATPDDVLTLSTRSSLRLPDTGRFMVCWPETHRILERLHSLELVLGESPKTQRIVVTADDAAESDFLERHAWRAPSVLAAPLPEHPLGRARFAVVDPVRRGAVVRAALDSVNPATALIWDPAAGGRSWSDFDDDPHVSTRWTSGGPPVEFAIAVELPTAGALSALIEAAREVLVLVKGSQLAYLHRLAHPLRSFRLPSEADRAMDRPALLRAKLREELQRGEPFGELLTLGPLFDEHDPAVVAAAALRALEARPPDKVEPADDIPLWAVIRLSVGRRHHVRTGDIVGALLNAVGVPKDGVGRVDVRESFTLVDVRAEWAVRARDGLDGTVLRGQRVAARIDRR
jgi:hypothetical protein